MVISVVHKYNQVDVRCAIYDVQHVRVRVCDAIKMASAHIVRHFFLSRRHKHVGFFFSPCTHRFKYKNYDFPSFFCVISFFHHLPIRHLFGRSFVRYDLRSLFVCSVIASHPFGCICEPSNEWIEIVWLWLYGAFTLTLCALDWIILANSILLHSLNIFLFILSFYLSFSRALSVIAIISSIWF